MVCTGASPKSYNLQLFLMVYLGGGGVFWGAEGKNFAISNYTVFLFESLCILFFTLGQLYSGY